MLMVFFRAIVVAGALRAGALEEVTRRARTRGVPERLDRRLLRRHRCCSRSPCTSPARCRGGCPCCSSCSSALLPFATQLGRVGSAIQVLALAVAFTGIAMAAVTGEHQRELPGPARLLRQHGRHDEPPAAAQAHGPSLAVRHGRRARPRGGADPGRRGLHRPADRDRPAVPAADEQLDLHPARPQGTAAPVRDRRTGGRDLDQRPGHRAVPGRPAARRLGLRHRRGRADHRAARDRLRADRARPGVRRAGRDPHLLLRGDHHRDPADREGRPVHRHQPGRRRARASTARSRRPVRWPR